MNKKVQIDFIKQLIEKSKNEIDGLFPSKIKLKLTDIELYGGVALVILSNKIVNIEEHGIIRESKVLEYDSIFVEFHLENLKTYLNTLENE